MFDVSGKVVIVTGGNKGIGEGIAKTFAKEGAMVSIWGRQAADNEKVKNEIIAAGGKCVAFIADITNEEHIAAAVQGTLDAFGGRIDVLINNAGGTTGGRLSWELTPEQWRKTLEVDMTGPFLVCRAVIPTMKAQRKGRIININSIVGLRMTHLSGVQYSAAKAGNLGFNRHLAVELGAYGITVNAICPGNVETPATTKLWSEEERKYRYSIVPTGHLAKPEDIATACIFLASDEAGSVNATAIPVDGGSVINWYDNETYHKLMGEPLPQDVLDMHIIPGAMEGLEYKDNLVVKESSGNL